MTVTEETVPASHYDRIGGASSVKAAVELFYDKVLADPELAGYFAGVDMAGQRRHLALMLTVVLRRTPVPRSLPAPHPACAPRLRPLPLAAARAPRRAPVLPAPRPTPVDQGVVVGDKCPVKDQTGHHNFMIDRGALLVPRDLALAVVA
ncbi:hypothetical protein ABZ749_14640 [Micromonospora sp. NPDC047753]|uniref:globin domain-containing protein n=1 Tax=Micromonospora sp. NPDC047753 TaxID=3154817 RepID=UPI0033DCECCC